MRFLSLAFLLTSVAQAQLQTAPPLAPASYEAGVVASYPPYVPQQQVAGVIRVSGHGSAKIPWMRSLLEQWERSFQRFEPGIHLVYAMNGTSSAIPALWAGAADVAILGEEIDPIAVRTFQRVRHYPPSAVDILTGSVDIRNIDYAQMFFVHRSNPLTHISLTELDAIFGEEHRRGAPANVRTWAQLGLKGSFATHPITPYGWRIDDSFGLFLEKYLLESSHRWNPALHEFSHINRPDGTTYDSGQQALDALAHDPDGLAVSNIRYAGPDVKALALGLTPAGPFYPASRQSLIERTYPLARVIPVVYDRPPGMPIDPRVREFLRFLLSREGQQVALDDDRYLPLSLAAAQREQEKLQ